MTDQTERQKAKAVRDADYEAKLAEEATMTGPKAEPEVIVKPDKVRKAKAAKATKPTARDKGVPDRYLSESGKFKPGYDAKYKSDLVADALEFETANSGRKSSPAHKQLQRMNWTGFLDKSRESRRAKREAAAKAAKAKPAKESEAA
jgi:hypothetical protein